MISAGKRYPPQRARAGVVIPPDYLPRYVRASVANVRQVDGASRRTFYRICSITSRLVSFEQAERFKARRASWKASATCSRRSGPPPAIRALHSQLFFDAGTTAWWRSRQTVAFVRNTAKWGTAIRPQLRPTFRRRHWPEPGCVRGNGELAMPEGGYLMLWRRYWPGRRARLLASRDRRLGVLLGSGSERQCRRGRAVLPEEPAYVSERDLDLLGVRLPRV